MRWNADSRWSTAYCCWSTRRKGRPQTRFVLRKALAKQLPVVLVVNKVDRSDARIAEVVDEVYELFFDLDATEDQIDFRSSTRAPVPVGRASSGRQNASMPDSPDLEPLFETLVSTVPAPTTTRTPSAGARHEPGCVCLLGRLAVCRIHAGTIRKGQQVIVVPPPTAQTSAKVSDLLHDRRLERKPSTRPGPATSSRSPGFRRSPSARPWSIRTTPAPAGDHRGRAEIR